MEMLIVTSKAALDALNATAPEGLKLTPRKQGLKYYLNPDLLNDCGAGDTWEHYGVFLQTLLSEDVTFTSDTSEV